jgi:hypothetical protein
MSEPKTLDHIFITKRLHRSDDLHTKPKTKCSVNKKVLLLSHRNTSIPILTYVIIMILLYSYLWSHVHGVVQIEKMDTNGLMFKKMGYVYTYEQSWKIITMIPEEKFTSEQKFIKTRINDIKMLQNSVGSENKNILIVMEEFERLNDVIKEINTIVTEERPKRQKRALFPFGGTLVEWILGNPDKYTVQEMLSQIENNKLKNNITDYFVRNQTIYMGKLIEAIENKNLRVNAEIVKLIDSIKYLASNFSELVLREEQTTELNTLTQHLTLVIIRYMNYQNKLLDHILSRDLVHIDPELIPLNFLKNTIDSIEKSLKIDQMLPWSVLEKPQILEWYRSIPMRTSVVNKNVILEFIIPIVSRSRKEIFESIPTPVPRDNLLMYIHPTAPYIITNEIRNEIGYLDQSDLDKCWQLSDTNFVCAGTFPIYNKQNQYMYCELALLLKTEDDINNCIIKTIPQRDLFIKIKNSDQFYFVFINKTHATKTCGEKVNDIVLEGTGLITINESCNIMNSKFRIASQSIDILYKQNEYISSNFKINVAKKQTENKYIINDSDLNNINAEFEILKEKLKTEEIMHSYHIKHANTNSIGQKIQTGISYSTAIIAICAIAILYYLYRNGVFKNRYTNVISFTAPRPANEEQPLVEIH